MGHQINPSTKSHKGKKIRTFLLHRSQQLQNWLCDIRNHQERSFVRQAGRCIKRVYEVVKAMCVQWHRPPLKRSSAIVWSRLGLNQSISKTDLCWSIRWFPFFCSSLTAQWIRHQCCERKQSLKEKCVKMYICFNFMLDQQKSNNHHLNIPGPLICRFVISLLRAEGNFNNWPEHDRKNMQAF